MVVPAAATTTAAAVPKAKGGALSAGGEVSALAVVMDEAGAFFIGLLGPRSYDFSAGG
jgi:hypothetical protein